MGTVPSTDDPVATARDLAERLLVPYAEQVDTGGVQRATVDQLAAAGLLGLSGPRAYGGAQAPPAVLREVQEVLAGADGPTWFVAVQHESPLRALAGSDSVELKERYLRAMCTGQRLAGIAIAHVRRPGPAAVTATRTAGGWRFGGRVGWATSWGIADLLLLAGVGGDGELVLVLVPAREQPGLLASAPLALAAMRGTSTVSLELADLFVPEADVVDVQRLDDWRQADRLRTANATPAVFGLLAAVVRRLGQVPEAAELSRRLEQEGGELRRAAYALVDHVPAHEQLADRLALRAAALELVNRAALALVAATGGSALALHAAPQRLAREAMFHLVQAQTPAVRAATLHRLGERTAAGR